MADEPFDLPGCLERVRRRDQAASRQLVEHLYPLVIRIVRSHLPRRVAEEDLAQDIFLKMFTRLAQYQGNVPFPHWVSRIAVTTCIDQLRAQKRRPEFRWADLSEGEADVLDAVMTDERDTKPGDALAARELVHKLLGQLKPDDQGEHATGLFFMRRTRICIIRSISVAMLFNPPQEMSKGTTGSRGSPHHS